MSHGAKDCNSEPTLSPLAPSSCSGYHYWEAEIVSRDSKGTLMEWHDGERERLRGGIDWPLHWIAEGIPIGLWVKLGPGNRVIDVWRNVKILNQND